MKLFLFNSGEVELFTPATTRLLILTNGLLDPIAELAAATAALDDLRGPIGPIGFEAVELPVESSTSEAANKLVEFIGLYEPANPVDKLTRALTLDGEMVEFGLTLLLSIIVCWLLTAVLALSMGEIREGSVCITF